MEIGFASLAPILPELLVAFGALLILILDTASPQGGSNRGYMAITAIFLLLGLAGAFVQLGGEPQTALYVVDVDAFSLFLKMIVYTAMLLTTLAGGGYLNQRVSGGAEFWSSYLFISVAMAFAVSANNLLMIFVAIEFLSITSYILVGSIREDLRSSEAGLKYFLYGSVASAIMLYGMTFMYGATGSLNLAEIGKAFAENKDIHAAVIPPRLLVMAGLGFETTLAAFRVGAAHGYRAFECAVKLSADGVPFLLHDATLQRTTPARGTAGARPWAELSRLDAGGWHSRAYAGEPIPSLDAVAAYCLRNGFALNIEIKPTPGQEPETGRVVAREAARLWAADRSGAAAPPLLSSFRPEALQGARETAPALPRALLLDTLWSGWFEVAQAIGCSACVTNHALMDEALIAQLRAAKMRALVYTVNDASEAQRLLRAGIDGIITDAVDKFSPAEGSVLD